MIDEELYQQAADELNSDSRRAHIWARACALASDDHDEARYLYTNLRVEELIAERETRSSTPEHQTSLQEDFDNTLSLEPISLGEEESFSTAGSNSLELEESDYIPESISENRGTDNPQTPQETDDFLELLSASGDSDAPVVSSQSAGFAERVEQQDTERSEALKNPDLANDDEPAFEGASLEQDFLDSYEEHQQNIKAAAKEESAEEFISSLDMTDPDLDQSIRPKSAHDEQQVDFDSTTEMDLDYEQIASMNDAAPHPVSSIHGGELDDQNDSVLHDDEPSWLQEEASTLPATQSGDRLNNEVLEDDRLALELERQADQLPGQRQDVIEHADLLDDTQEVAFAAQDQPEQTHPTAPAATAAASEVAHTENLPFNLPVDLTLGERGKEFAVYKRDEKSQAVSTGVSWSALFFTLPYLVYRHLFGTAIMYSILWIIALGGLLVTGLVWMDAGSAATTLIKVSAIGFALLAIIGLLYIPFRYGNIWRGEKLEKRGFELVAWTRASSSGKAVTKARRAAALD